MKELQRKKKLWAKERKEKSVELNVFFIATCEQQTTKVPTVAKTLLVIICWDHFIFYTHRFTESKKWEKNNNNTTHRTYIFSVVKTLTGPCGAVVLLYLVQTLQHTNTQKAINVHSINTTCNTTAHMIQDIVFTHCCDGKSNKCSRTNCTPNTHIISFYRFRNILFDFVHSVSPYH